MIKYCLFGLPLQIGLHVGKESRAAVSSGVTRLISISLQLDLGEQAED